MANLKTFSGFPIQNLTSDPVPYAQALADNPYVGTWASQNNLNTTRSQAAGFGTASNMGAAGGNTGSVVNNFELWNGTSWTETTEINTARRNAKGVGAYTQGMIFGGYTATAGSVNTETWNGSAWTEVNDMTRSGGQQSQASFGTYTAAIAAGGEPGTTYFKLVESWNGTSWTDVAELNTGRNAAAGFGLQPSGFIIGGVNPTISPNPTSFVESWNGSAWTETTDINTARGALGASGITTAGIIYGGNNPGGNIAKTESWNGSAWSEVNDLATARGDGGYSPNPSTGSTSALLADGSAPGSPGFVSATEEWAFTGLNPATTPAADYSDAIVGQMYYNSTSGQFKAIKNGGAPIGTWASGGAMNTARDNNAGAGTQTSAMSINGTNPPPTNLAIVELYDGSSWTETTDTNTARRYGSANGPSGNTNVIYMGGYSTTNTGDTETWNGSSWTEVNNLNVGRNNLGSAGTSTANLAFGGEGNPPVGGNLALTELRNGSSWTEVNDLNEGRNSKTGAGTSTAALSTDAAPNTNAELWDGTSWTETTNFNTSRNGSVMTNSSPQNDAILITGQTAPGSFITNCEHWNGTSWTEIADVGTAMTRGGGAGSGGTSGIKFGGSTPSNTTATEEFTAADFTINPVTTS